MVYLNIYGETLEQLEIYMESINEKKFHAKQLFRWIYDKRISSFDEITDMKKDVISKLKEDFSMEMIKIIKVEKGKDVIIIDRPKDDTIKKTMEGGSINDVLEICNIPPKCVVTYHLHGAFNESDEFHFKIWDVNTKKCVQTLEGHASNVICLLLHSSGLIISSSGDRIVKIWKNQ